MGGEGGDSDRPVAAPDASDLGAGSRAGSSGTFESVESSSAGWLCNGALRDRALVRGAGEAATGACSEGYIRTSGVAAAISSPPQQPLERTVVKPVDTT